MTQFDITSHERTLYFTTLHYHTLSLFPPSLCLHTSLTHSLTHSHSFIHSLTHTHSFILSLNHSLTHSAHMPSRLRLTQQMRCIVLYDYLFFLSFIILYINILKAVHASLVSTYCKYRVNTYSILRFFLYLSSF